MEAVDFSWMESESTLRAYFEEINLNNALQFVEDNLQGKDLIDHLEVIHDILLKDIIPQDRRGCFREEIVAVVKGSVITAVKENQNTIREELRYLQKELEGFSGLERVCIEHIKLLEIHPFIDGNGRLARFVLGVELMRMGAVYCYGFLKKDNEYIQAMDKYWDGGDLGLFTYLSRMVRV